MLYERNSPYVSGHNFNRVAIFRMQDNTTPTSGGSSDWPIMNTGSILTPVVPLYNTELWVPEDGIACVKYTGTHEMDFEFICTSELNTTFTAHGQQYITLLDSNVTGNLTGSVQSFLAGTPADAANSIRMGVVNVGYARVTKGETISLKVNKNYSGDLVLRNIMFVIRPLL